MECNNMCGAECESVVYMLWECSAYSTCLDNFMEDLKQLLGNKFDQLSDIDITSYMLGCKI